MRVEIRPLEQGYLLSYERVQTVDVDPDDEYGRKEVEIYDHEVACADLTELQRAVVTMIEHVDSVARARQHERRRGRFRRRR